MDEEREIDEAQSLTTPPARLVELAYGSLFARPRIFAMRNPNLPTETLLKERASGGLEAWRNPQASLVALTHPPAPNEVWMGLHALLMFPDPATVEVVRESFAPWAAMVWEQSAEPERALLAVHSVAARAFPRVEEAKVWMVELILAMIDALGEGDDEARNALWGWLTDRDDEALQKAFEARAGKTINEIALKLAVYPNDAFTVSEFVNMALGHDYEPQAKRLLGLARMAKYGTPHQGQEQEHEQERVRSVLLAEAIRTTLPWSTLEPYAVGER